MPEEKELLEDENTIDTVIADDISFSGTLSFKSSLKIKGSFEGKIDTTGHLIVGTEASVSADVKARIVTISGEAKGKFKADERVELYKKSNVQGDIVAPDLYIESGSNFNGTCIMKS